MSEQSSRGPAWEATRLAVLERDAWTCVYCGKDLTLEAKDATVDHVIPKDAGGTDDPWNLVASCRRDNGRKGARMMLRMPWFDSKWLDRLPA